MKEVKVESDDKNVQITCPHCGNWEQIGVDEPRHRFESMPITDWIHDHDKLKVFGAYTSCEVSVNQCSECDNKFEVEWDYDNKFKND